MQNNTTGSYYWTNNTMPYWSVVPPTYQDPALFFGTTCIYCGHDSTELICNTCMEALEFKPTETQETCCANPHPHVPGGIHCQRD